MRAAFKAGSQWAEVHPHGPVEAGHVGGDIQAGEAFSRRWARPLRGGGWAVVDRTFYVVSAGLDDPTPTGIQEQRYYGICRDIGDVGGTEQCSDYAYEMADAAPFTDDAARTLCAEADITDMWADPDG